MNLLDEVDKHRSDIVTDTYTATWRELLSQYQDGDLIINPDYQRLFRWDADQQTQYIESLLLSIPSPPVFLARNDDGRFEVLDGLQRISTVLKFFAAERPPKTTSEPPELEGSEADVEQNDIFQPSVLMTGRILPSLEGETAASIPETLIRVIKYARVTIILIEKGSQRRARYEVFRRLNRFGSLLSDQEIRNCTARLLGTAFPDALRRLAKEPVIRSVLALSDEARKNMGIEESLLRLLAFNFGKNKLRHQIREYLDEFMEYASEGHFVVTTELAARIISMFEMIHQAVPDGTAFRLKNQGFSTNVFDIVATGAWQNLHTLTPTSFASKLEAIQNSSELKGLIGAGSNTRKKLEGRLNLGLNWFRP